MSMNAGRWTIAMALAGCTPVGTAPGASEPGVARQMPDRCDGDFGTTVAATKLESFLTATADFTVAASELEGTLIAACEDMGKELGVDTAASSAAAKAGTPKVRAICEPVRAKLSTELQGLRADAKLDVAVHATPPRCEAELSGFAECVAECDVDVDPGALDVRCEGGELRGQCEGECYGTCAADVEGTCGGSCEGACSGACSGTCLGACDGQCSATAADGSCQGACDGVCEGSCSAGCEGSCDGTCVAKASGHCDGVCRGECSVAFEEPRCTGELRAPKASAECEASCNAKLDADLDCEPGELQVAVTGAADSNIPERAARVRAALEGGMARVLEAEAKLKKLGTSGKAMVRTAGALPRAVGDLGVGAAACATAAAAQLPKVTASVSASVQVSASLSATAHAG